MKNWVNLTKHEGTDTIVDTTEITGLSSVKHVDIKRTWFDKLIGGEDLSYSTFRFQLGSQIVSLEYENQSDAIKERGLILSAIFDNENNNMFEQEK